MRCCAISPTPAHPRTRSSKQIGLFARRVRSVLRLGRPCAAVENFRERSGWRLPVAKYSAEYRLAVDSLGNKNRCELPARPISDIKRAAMRIENARSAFANKPMKFLGSNRLSEGFAENVEEIENQRLLYLDLLMRPL